MMWIWIGLKVCALGIWWVILNIWSLAGKNWFLRLMSTQIHWLTMCPPSVFLLIVGLFCSFWNRRMFCWFGKVCGLLDWVLWFSIGGIRSLTLWRRELQSDISRWFFHLSLFNFGQISFSLVWTTPWFIVSDSVILSNVDFLPLSKSSSRVGKGVGLLLNGS